MQVIQQAAGLAGSSPVLRIESFYLQGSSQQRHSTAPLSSPVQHLVPWVAAIIQGVRPADCVIVIAPPAGLLELGQRQQLAEQLGVVTVPCPALPCPALPCPALPCPALPCPALPY